MGLDSEFMRWFVDYIHEATLADLKKEPLNWNERMAYLHTKFEESKNEPRDNSPKKKQIKRYIPSVLEDRVGLFILLVVIPICGLLYFWGG